MHRGADSPARRHDDPGTRTPHTYQVLVAANVELLTSVRHELTAWLQRLELGRRTVKAVELACYEAMSNVAEHAYGDGDTDGQLSLEATVYPDRLTVVVSDRGQWRERSPEPHPYGGMGLDLIRQLADHAVVDASHHGTVVSMTWFR